MKIIVSKCLIGCSCRYDGKSVPNPSVIALGDRYALIPVCPEELGGLQTPRVPAEISKGRVIRKDGVDVTEEYERGALASLEIALEQGCKVAILKSKSPSCGKSTVYDGSFSGRLISGIGVTAKLFKDNGIQIFDENETDKIK